MIVGMGMHEAPGPGEHAWLSGPAEPPEQPDEPVESYDPRIHRPPRERVGILWWDDMERIPARIRSSEVTFGLRGRLVVTGVIMLFCAWLSFTNIFFLIPALPAVVWALRDTWRRAPASRGPAPTQARDLGGRIAARGPDDDLLPNRLQPIVPVLGWDADRPGSDAHLEATDAELAEREAAAAAAAPSSGPAPTQASRSKDAEWLERLMLDPGLASRVRDKPRVVPPPFPGEGGRAPAQADGSASASPA
jgi:hypothetical protein